MGKRRSKKKIKKFWLGVFFAICIAINAWYMLVVTFAPDKTYDTTFNLGMQTAQDGSSAYFTEILYMSNANENGLESFEVKFNYLTDDEKTAIYSQGMQYVANTSEDSLNWIYYVDESYNKQKIGSHEGWYTGERHYASFGSILPNTYGASVYNYMSDNDYDRVWNSTDPLNADTSFKVQIGDEIFLMRFKDKNTPMEDMSFYNKLQGDYKFYGVFGYYEIDYYYAYYDVNFYSYMLFNAINGTIKPGTSDVITFQMADMFDYQIYQNGQFVDVEEKLVASVKQKITNYFSIKVTVSEDGVQKASEDSLFNCVHGNSNYNTTGDYSSTDYFYGRTVITLTIEDFELIYVGDTNSVALKLKQSFIDYRLPYKNNIVLLVKIDNDYLAENNMEFFWFADESGLEKFNVYKVVTLETIDGQIVETEVEYA